MTHLGFILLAFLWAVLLYIKNIQRFERSAADAGLKEWQGYLIIWTMAFILIESAYWALYLIYLGITT